jgi:hypothetical protein
MNVKIEMNVECDRQREGDHDEVYVAAGIAFSGGRVMGRCVWEGCLRCDDPARQRSGPFEVWSGELPDGEVVAFLLSVIEQDESGFARGKAFGEKIARRAAGCIAESRDNAINALAECDFGPAIGREASAIGSLKTDDLIGTVMIVIADGDGKADVRVRPVAQAETKDGRFVLSGNASSYAVDLGINGRWVGQSPDKATR